MIEHMKFEDGYEVTWIDRVGWGADPNLSYINPRRIGDVFHGWGLHHTVMVLQDYDRDGFLFGDIDDVIRYMQILQKIRPELGDVPYSAVPFQGVHPRHAIMCEGRGRGIRGAHTGCFNHIVYAWGIASNTMLRPVTPGMVFAMRWLAGEWTPNATRQTLGHQQFDACYSNGMNLNATACPGTGGLKVLPNLQPPFSKLIPIDPDIPDPVEPAPAGPTEAQKLVLL